MAFIHSSGLHHTFQWSSSCIISGIEWSSSGPYFDGSFVVGDITFHSVFWPRYVQYAEQDARQMSLTYTPYLPVNGGDSVPKRCASAILDEGHCSGLHQSTRCMMMSSWSKLSNPIFAYRLLGDAGRRCSVSSHFTKMLAMFRPQWFISSFPHMLGPLLITVISKISIGMRTWISNYIHVKQWGCSHSSMP